MTRVDTRGFVPPAPAVANMTLFQWVTTSSARTLAVITTKATNNIEIRDTTRRGIAVRTFRVVIGFLLRR
jgi:hypothetical protein